MAGEIALFLINQVLEETPSTWVPGDPLYDDPRQEDEDENFDPQPSIYVRPMFELLYDDPDDHPYEYFFGSWDQRRSSYRWRPPREKPKPIVLHTMVQDQVVLEISTRNAGPFNLPLSPEEAARLVSELAVEWRLEQL